MVPAGNYIFADSELWLLAVPLLFGFKVTRTYSMDIEELALKHKALLEAQFRSSTVALSEYSFASVYLFRDVHKYQIVMTKDIYIKGVTYDGFSHLMPTSQKALQLLEPRDELLQGIDFIFPIPEEWQQTLDLKLWEVSHNDADSDYLFDTKTLSHYSGRHLSKKRNLVSQFTEHYQAEEKAFGKEHTQDALRLLDMWRLNPAHASDEQSDVKACQEAIEHFEALQLEGKIYYVGAQAVGFMIGEGLSPEVFVIHFAKADISYKGIYQYMYQVFCQGLEDRFTYINMEQDMGRPELRQAKHSYQPTRLLKKLRLKPISPVARP